MDGLKNLFKSKKATALIAGIALVIFREGLGVDPQFAEEIIKLVLAYLGTQGAVDLALVLKGQKNA